MWQTQLNNNNNNNNNNIIIIRKSPKTLGIVSFA
jgi:hypothetical protein